MVWYGASGNVSLGFARGWVWVVGSVVSAGGWGGIPGPLCLQSTAASLVFAVFPLCDFPGLQIVLKFEEIFLGQAELFVLFSVVVLLTFPRMAGVVRFGSMVHWGLVRLCLWSCSECPDPQWFRYFPLLGFPTPVVGNSALL